MTSHIQHVTDDSFEAEVTHQPGLVLVDFWAPWCAPCKALAPVLEELAGEYHGQVRIAKVNADDQPQSGKNHLVRGLPTLILFQDGAEIERVVGASSKTRLAAFLDRHLEA